MMRFFAAPGVSDIALKTTDWDKFYSSWVKPITQLLIPLVIALVVLISVSGLLTRFMVRHDTEAWPRPTRWFWVVVGALSLVAAAAFLPIYPMFHPFNNGAWLTWAFVLGVATPGVALAILASRVKVSRRIKTYIARPGIPWSTFWLLLLLWAGLVSCFFSWGSSNRLLVAYIGLAVLGTTSTATALGQNLRLQVESQTADGKADAAATDYVLARLQSLGSKAPEFGISRASELSKLVSEDLSAIPAGSIAAAIARIMYAIRPGLTWRARLTLVDVNRVTVTLTRNGLHVQSTVISRANLGLPPLAPDDQTPQLVEEQGRARAQLLTGAAACVLVDLSRGHPHLRVGLCGATQWKSIALQVIATEPALTTNPEIRLKLLQAAVNVEPEYGLARFDYLIELFARTPKTISNRMRFASLMDAQLPLSEKEEVSREGWEVIHMRILYSRAAMRVNAYLMALAVGDERVQQLRSEYGDTLAAAHESATRLTSESTEFATRESNHLVSESAQYMKPAAQNLQSAITFLIDEAHRRAGGGNWTWTPPVPSPHPSPRLAGHYASLAGLADEYGVPRGDLDDPLNYLAFAVATRQDRQGIRQDPSFCKFLRDPVRASLIAEALSFKPVCMLELAPFEPYADMMTKAGITTFEQFRQWTSTDTLSKELATYLATSTIIISHLADIATLADTHENLASSEVLQVFLDAGITSRDELRSWATTHRDELISMLAAGAERYGISDLAAFTTPNSWLSSVT
ncbi:hypothetical protein [Streptomyces sp. NPDC005096]|uniref:hypothetical protein n=1 Tax=Streptomyces sp. NPDC005096 TaxID=3154559 RepID=UPI0033AE332F